MSYGQSCSACVHPSDPNCERCNGSEMAGDERPQTGRRSRERGVAKKTLPGGKLTQPGTMVGTLHYTSPEQIVSPDKVDHRADLWALPNMRIHPLPSVAGGCRELLPVLPTPLRGGNTTGTGTVAACCRLVGQRPGEDMIHPVPPQTNPSNVGGFRTTWPN